MPDTPISKAEAADRRDAYYAAGKRLRDQFPEEFNTLVGEEMKARKVEWSPKKTQAQKDEEAVRSLLAKNPDLMSSLLHEQGQVGSDTVVHDHT